MVSRCDNDNKRPGPLEAEVIPVLHSVAEANASDESDGVAKQEDEQIGIFMWRKGSLKRNYPSQLVTSPKSKVMFT